MTLGLVAAPDLAEEIAAQLSDQLPGLLAQRVSDKVTWQVPHVTDARIGDVHGGVELVDAGREIRLEQGWDLAVCLTDLPIRVGRRPVAADASATHGVATVCLPALGATRLPERARDSILRLVDGLVGASLEPGDRDRRQQREQVQDRLDELAGDGGPQDGRLRLVAGTVTGHLRLLAGMVRANRPWRVVVALSRAIVAALSTIALATVNPSIWQLSDAMGWPRLLAVAAAAIVALVASLIIAHALWERPSRPEARGQAILFNATTVITLTIGVLCLYGALFVIELVAAALVIDASVLHKQLGHAVDVGDYLTLAWMASSLATIGGALGSGLESDDSVRAAAYGYRPDQQAADGRHAHQRGGGDDRDA